MANTGRKTEIDKVIARMYREAYSYEPVECARWYVWVSKSGFVSSQDGTPANPDAYFWLPASYFRVAAAEMGGEYLPAFEYKALCEFLG